MTATTTTPTHFPYGHFASCGSTAGKPTSTDPRQITCRVCKSEYAWKAQADRVVPETTTTTDLTALAAQLRTATSRKDAHAALTGLSRVQLQTLCRKQDITVYANATKPKLRHAIVEHLTGCRLDHWALANYRR